MTSNSNNNDNKDLTVNNTINIGINKDLTMNKSPRIGIHTAAEVRGASIVDTSPETYTLEMPGGTATFERDGTLKSINPKSFWKKRGLRREATAIMMMAKAPQIVTPAILTVAGGFYFFGDLVQGHPDYATLKNGAMFGGFEGGKGLPGVARGDSAARVNLDRFDESQTIQAPLFSGAVLAIFRSINLYTFPGTTLR